jgi:hypothetical protein
MVASINSEMMIVEDSSSSSSSSSISGIEVGNKTSIIDSSSSIDLLLAQSIITLEILLKNDATVFVPYLNVIIPALVKVVVIMMMMMMMMMMITMG